MHEQEGDDYSKFKELISSNLSASDDANFTRWAREKFLVNARNAAQVLSRLEASDLNPVRDFFQSKGKIELVHIVDKFLEGDCESLLSVQNEVNERMKKSSRTRMSGQDSNPGTSGATENTNDPLPLLSDSSTNGVASQSDGPFTGTIVFTAFINLILHKSLLN